MTYTPSSVAMPHDYDDPAIAYQQAGAAPLYLHRTRLLPIPYLAAALICGLSWVLGGAPVLTDLGFCIIAAASLLFLFAELRGFSQRFGMGGIVLFGGVLVWFCHDYFSNWFGHEYDSVSVTQQPAVIAKAAALHALFIAAMTVGLLIRRGRWMSRLISFVPEPSFPGFYLGLVVMLLIVGISPFFLFTAEPWYMAIWNTITGGRVGGAAWTVGRTGNVNYSWGAYIALWLQIGQAGGILAAFYALLIARQFPAKLFGWAVWLLWFLLAFGSGTRSEVLLVVLPPMALLYMKYQAIAVLYMRRHSYWIYVPIALVGLATLFAVQFQAAYRATSYSDGELSAVDLFKAQGNTMFSEGLTGYQLIPEHVPYFYDRIPGETIVRPIPDTIFWFVVNAIPRALWSGKPVDPAWEWYNAVYQSKLQGREGTTVSQGLVGSWYFRYGVFGVIEGGLLVGWLLLCAERALQGSAGRPMVLFASLGMLTWLFRCFRSFNFLGLYPLIISMLVLYVAVRLTGSSSSSSGSPETQDAPVA